MRLGAVVMMDALGFKGIWQRYSEESILEKMRALRGFVDRETLDHIIPLHPTIRKGAVILSDTIVVWCHLTETSEGDQALGLGLTLHVACFVAATASFFAGTDKMPRLCFRGAVSVGEFVVEETTIMGEAIDEVATEHQKAQGGLTWLTPRAMAVVRGCRTSSPHASLLSGPLLIDNYPVPLHSGETFRTSVLNPFGGARLTAQQVRDFQSDILSTFGSPALDVQIKRQNTENLMRHAESVWRTSGTTG